MARHRTKTEGPGVRGRFRRRDIVRVCIAQEATIDVAAEPETDVSADRGLWALGARPAGDLTAHGIRTVEGENRNANNGCGKTCFPHLWGERGCHSRGQVPDDATARAVGDAAEDVGDRRTMSSALCGDILMHQLHVRAMSTTSLILLYRILAGEL